MKLLFIGGAQRSGTSLVQSLCCASTKANDMPNEAEHLRVLLQGYKYGKDIFARKTKDYFASPEAYAGFYRETVLRYIEQAKSVQGEHEWLVLKDPLFAKVSTEIAEILPEAHFVCMVRDPRDVIASMLTVSQKWEAQGKPPMWPRDMTVLAREYDSYYSAIAPDYQATWQGRFMFLRYEDIVTDTKRTLEGINGAFGLDLPMSLGDSGATAGSFTYSQAFHSDKLGGPLDPSSVGKFREVLTPGEGVQLNSLLDRYFQAFGYTT